MVGNGVGRQVEGQKGESGSQAVGLEGTTKVSLLTRCGDGPIPSSRGRFGTILIKELRKRNLSSPKGGL